MVSDRSEAQRVVVELAGFGLRITEAYFAYDRQSERPVLLLAIPNVKSRHDVYMTAQKALAKLDATFTLDSLLILSSSDPEVRSLAAASQANQKSAREGKDIEVMGRLLSEVVRLRLDGRSVEKNVIEVLGRMFPNAELITEKASASPQKPDKGNYDASFRLGTRADAVLYFSHDAVLVEVVSAALPLSSRQLTAMLGILLVEDRLSEVRLRFSLVVVSTSGFTRSAQDLAQKLESVELVAWQTTSGERDLYEAVSRLTQGKG